VTCAEQRGGEYGSSAIRALTGPGTFSVSVYGGLSPSLGAKGAVTLALARSRYDRPNHRLPPDAGARRTSRHTLAHAGDPPLASPQETPAYRAGATMCTTPRAGESAGRCWGNRYGSRRRKKSRCGAGRAAFAAHTAPVGRGSEHRGRLHHAQAQKVVAAAGREVAATRRARKDLETVPNRLTPRHHTARTRQSHAAPALPP
jgi:hypothetical protein